jgi:UDP-N-acetylmuramate--alanine ligase
MNNIKKEFKVHFIGIGGVSMSGLAEYFCREGFTVSGSDR